MAIARAVQLKVPFVVSPCCTAKGITKRINKHGLSEKASIQRSASPSTISFPRSEWLRSSLQEIRNSSKEPDFESSIYEYYSLIAKVADVGLGPQTPVEQRRHQRLAKLVVEFDRLVETQENYAYLTRLLRLPSHDNYGKAEILLGAPAGSVEAFAIQQLQAID